MTVAYPGPMLCRFSIVACLFIIAGCANGPGGGVAAGGSSCEKTCNSEYDTCNGRFAGISGDSGFGRASEDSSTKLGPNSVCPDQMKACLRRCLN